MEDEPELLDEFPKELEELPKLELPMPGPVPTGVLPAGCPTVPALPPSLVRSAWGS